MSATAPKTPLQQAIEASAGTLRVIVDETRRAECKEEMVRKQEYLLYAMEFELKYQEKRGTAMIAARDQLKADVAEKRKAVNAIKFNGKERKEAVAILNAAESALTTHEVEVLLPIKSAIDTLISRIAEDKAKLDEAKMFA